MSEHSDSGSRNNAPVLEIRNLVKHFGAIEALKGVSFELRQGQVIGLVGDNGAGKSTLVKIISGVHTPTSGEVILDGDKAHFANPAQARHEGIETVYQDLGLVDNLDIAGNFYLGRELRRGGLLAPFAFLDNRAMRTQARESIDDLHVKIPGGVTQKVERLSGGQRQAVAIARAAFWKRKLLLLDEPTAALGVEAADEVTSHIRQMAAEKLPIIVISHNIDHIMDFVDTLVVLRQGVKVAELVRAETTAAEVVGYITGTIKPGTV